MLVLTACGSSPATDGEDGKTPPSSEDAAATKEAQRPLQASAPADAASSPVSDTLSALSDADAGATEGDRASALEDDATDVDSAAPEKPAEPTDPDAPEADPAASQPHPGPCSVNWSSGTRLAFEYHRDGEGKAVGGTVEVDLDGTGKVKTCGAFELDGDRTRKLEIDEGCTGKAEVTVVPKYDPRLNVATATIRSGDGSSREITLVVLPGYVGLTPGYLVQAPRKEVDIKTRAGKVQSITVKSPAEGPAVKASFTYTKEGRIRQIREDFGVDGKMNRDIEYRYDAIGNITRMNSTLHREDARDASTARPNYACHR